MSYRPRPIDVSHVQLPAEIEALTERLAMNSHDIWASQRLADGWTFGAKRSDEHKHHPSLIPYDKLPEAEKVYDRRVTLETLRAIMALGYRIEKAAPADPHHKPRG